MQINVRDHKATLATGAVAVLLATGWSVREAQFASAQGKKVQSALVNSADVKVTNAKRNGKQFGKAQVYLDGETTSNKSLVVGHLELAAGHADPPHRHADEELLIVTKGTAEVLCNGKKYQAKPGAVMYADPNVEHGISNSTDKPVEFWWIKYIPKGK